jgi:hypothetical protein
MQYWHREHQHHTGTAALPKLPRRVQDASAPTATVRPAATSASRWLSLHDVKESVAVFGRPVDLPAVAAVRDRIDAVDVLVAD